MMAIVPDIWPRQGSSLVMKSYKTGKINWPVKASHQNTAMRCHYCWVSISDIPSHCMHSYFFYLFTLFVPPEFFFLSFFSSCLLFSIVRTHIQIVLAVSKYRISVSIFHAVPFPTKTKGVYTCQFLLFITDDDLVYVEMPNSRTIVICQNTKLV